MSRLPIIFAAAMPQMLLLSLHFVVADVSRASKRLLQEEDNLCTKAAAGCAKGEFAHACFCNLLASAVGRHHCICKAAHLIGTRI